jgi:hypothetical protein
MNSMPSWSAICARRTQSGQLPVPLRQNRLFISQLPGKYEIDLRIGLQKGTAMQQLQARLVG